MSLNWWIQKLQSEPTPIFDNLLNQGAPATASFSSKPTVDKQQKQAFAAGHRWVESNHIETDLNLQVSLLLRRARSQSMLCLPRDASQGLPEVGTTKTSYAKNCFMLGHAGKVCTRQWVCKVPGCLQRHNTLLHSDLVIIVPSDNNNNNNHQTTPQTTKLLTVTKPSVSNPSKLMQRTKS